MIKLCKNLTPLLHIYTINVWISPVESLGGRTPTHKVLIYVSGHKITSYKVSTSSMAALIPPPPLQTGKKLCRHQGDSVIVCGQLAICAAWSFTYNCSSAKFCRATRISLLATARILWRSAAGHEQIAATVWRDSRSIGRGSISDSRFELAMHKSGTAGLDITCCGVEAPRWPAYRCCTGLFAGVTRLGMTTGESTSHVPISMSDPAGSSASGMSRGGDNSIRLPSDDQSSQFATASRICVRKEFGWTDVTNDMSKIICSWSTAALKNLRNDVRVS